MLPLSSFIWDSHHYSCILLNILLGDYILGHLLVGMDYSGLIFNLLIICNIDALSLIFRSLTNQNLIDHIVQVLLRIGENWNFRQVLKSLCSYSWCPFYRFRQITSQNFSFKIRRYFHLLVIVLTWSFFYRLFFFECTLCYRTKVKIYIFNSI